MDIERPDDDAYGRVTNPERYRPVADAAAALIDELAAGYDVARSTGSSGDDFPDWLGSPSSTTRLVPGHGAPLVFMITDFPGAVVRFGEWTVEAFPGCGCDACDERPEDEVERMYGLVEAAVAGHYEEELTRRELRHSTTGGSSRTRLGRGEWRRHGRPGRHRWPPWPRREA